MSQTTSPTLTRRSTVPMVVSIPPNCLLIVRASVPKPESMRRFGNDCLYRAASSPQRVGANSSAEGEVQPRDLAPRPERFQCASRQASE
jgi:hypothetical protein